MKRALAVCALLALSALAPSAHAQTKAADARVAALVAALGDEKNYQARNDAYLALMREHPPAAVALLLESLPRMNVVGQELGLAVLQGYPDEVARAALRKLLDARWPLLEAGAGAVLHRLGETDAIEHVLKPFARKDLALDLRRALLGRVYAIRDARLSAAIRAWLVPEAEPALLEDAFYQLILADDAQTRSRAGELAATPGLPAASRVACAACLVALGEDSSSAVLAAAVRADDGPTLSRLQRFLLRAPALGEDLRAAVAELAERTATPVYAQMALVVLGQHAGAKQIPVLERLLDSPSAIVSKAALEALQKRGGGISHEVLARMLGSSDAARALAAADALRREDDLAGLERVLELASTAGPERAEALRVLSRFRVMRAVPVLLDGLADGDVLVRSAAETGLVALLPNLFPYRSFDLASSGYSARGAAETRSAALQKLRAWWSANARK